MQNSFGATSTIDEILAVVASSDESTHGLRALASEVGGRRGRQYRLLAQRIERGENPSRPITPSSTDRAPSPSPVASLTRYAFLERSRRTSQRHVMWVCVLSCLYLICAFAVGWFVLWTTAPLATDVMDDLGFSDSHRTSNAALLRFFIGFYFAAIVMVAVAGGLLLVRLGRSTPAWVERVWDLVPMVGPTLRAGDLAVVSEAIYVSLLGGNGYSDAFEVASRSTSSTVLRRWLRESKTRFDAGEAMGAIAHSLPGRGELIAGVLATLSTNSTAPAVIDLWRETSIRMHRMMIERTQRLRTVFAPVMVVISLLVASYAFVLAMGTLYQIVEFISNYLTY